MAFLPLAVCSLHPLREALKERLGVMPFFFLFAANDKMVFSPGMTDWKKKKEHLTCHFSPAAYGLKGRKEPLIYVLGSLLVSTQTFVQV